MNTWPSASATKTRRPPGASKKRAPRPGAAWAIVERADDAGLLLDVAEHLALVEGVVAEGDAVGAGLEEQRGVRAGSGRCRWWRSRR